MASLDQGKTGENNNMLYISVGISVLTIIIFLFAPWLTAFNGSVSTLSFWRALDHIGSLRSSLYSLIGFDVPSEELIILRVALIVAFVIPILLGAYIVNSLMTKKMNKKLSMISTIVGVIICFIWMWFSSMMQDSPEIAILVVMKSSDFMNMLNSLMRNGYSSFPIGAAQFLTLILLISNAVVVGIRPKVVTNCSEVIPKETNIITKYFIKSLPLVVITVIIVLISANANNAITFFIGHIICLILAGMAAAYIGWPVGLIVSIIYGLFYSISDHGFYSIFDSAFIIVLPFLLIKLQDFKIRIGIFTGIGVFYGIFMFALRGGYSYGKLYDGGKNIIIVILYYIILCVLAYLFFEFGWEKVKSHLPKKVQDYFTPVAKQKIEDNKFVG